MNQKIRYSRGLKVIPDYVLKTLPKETISLLMVSGHGLSFPCVHFCQVRIRRGNKTHSKVFSYAKYDGNVKATINAAMVYYHALYNTLNEKGEVRKDPKGKGGIYYTQRIDKRYNKMVYAHQVFYTNPENGKRKSKTFWHKSGTPPTPGQILHGHRTALFFLAEQDRIARQFGTCIKHERFHNWKHVRHYAEGTPSVDYNSL